jgi:Arc/MetJ family transcription regulator
MVKKRTNLNLDIALVDRAASVLGTRGATATVHAAMEEVVRRARRERLAARDFPDLMPQAQADMRTPRSAGAAPRRRVSR